MSNFPVFHILATYKPVLFLPNAQKTRARADFVTERATNLSRGEGHLVVVELQKLLEVEELALSSLRTQETRNIAMLTFNHSFANNVVLHVCLPSQVTSRTNAAFEHKIEFLRFRKFIAAFRRTDVVLFDDLGKLRTAIVIDLAQRDRIRKQAPLLPSHSSLHT